MQASTAPPPWQYAPHAQASCHPPSWPERQAVTRRLGDALLRDATSTLIKVPSAAVSDSWNHLPNPARAEAAKVKVVRVTPDPFDARLFAQA